MKRRKVIFISNDFGFGPVSRTHTIAKALSECDQGLEIRIATNGKNDYLFDKSVIIFDRLDDLRDPTVISKYLSMHDPQETMIVSVMNRFALLSSKDLGFMTVLVDGLYWFWVNRPKEYDQADYQLRMLLPWQENRFSDSNDIFYFSSPVDMPMDVMVDRGSKSHKVLFTLNGFVTPFYKPSHDVYLEFSALVANQLGNSSQILLTGNRDVKNKITTHLNEKVSFESLNKSNYLSQLKSAEYVLLNGGSNSFLEALVLGKDFIFSLPSNQSQYALIDDVAKYTSTIIIDWCPLLEVFDGHEKILSFKNEGDAIDYWSEQIRYLLDDDKAMAKINKILGKLPERISKLENQTKQLRAHSEEPKESTNRIAIQLMRLADGN